MAENQLLRAAIGYAERGYKVFPCVPNGKTPLTAKGFYDATTDTEQVERWWEEHPNANIAIWTEGFLVLDVDGDDNPWLKHQPDLNLSMAGSPMALTPRGGSHRWFRCPFGKLWPNTTGKIAPQVDTRGEGGYVLVPPSVGANGTSYRWVEGSDLDIAPDALPIPPDWLADILDTLEAKRIAGDNRGLNHTGGEHGNVIPLGQRNSTLASVAGYMRQKGLTQKEIAAAILRINEDRCATPLPKPEVEKIAWSISRYEPDQVMTALVEGHFEQDRLEAGQDDGPENPGPFPVELLDVPGIIGGIIDYCNRTGFRRQPVLALGAAIAMVGTIAGRKVRDEYNTRTNVYCLGVAPSGAGKERARQVCKEILFHAGGRHLIGPEGFASHSGLVAAVESQPAILFQIDEIGRVLAAIKSASSSPHMVHVVTNLMKLFSSANSVYLSDAYADLEKNKAINQPNACLWGTTVPESFYEALTRESVSDGFISRLLVFESGADYPDKQAPELLSLPKDIVEGVKEWLEFKPGGNLSGENPEPASWHTDSESFDLFDQFDTCCDEKVKDAKNQYRAIWTRATEKARKLAMIHACSQGVEKGKIDAESAMWGIAVSEYLTKRIIRASYRWVSENGNHRRLQLILRVVEEWLVHSPDGMSQRDLVRRTQSLTTREREEAINTLLLCGTLAKEVVSTATKPKTLYRIGNLRI